MSQVLTGVTAIFTGNNDIAVLAEILSCVDFDTLQEANKGIRLPLTITRDQFEIFIARNARSFIDAGLLDEELVPTGNFTGSLN